MRFSIISIFCLIFMFSCNEGTVQDNLVETEPVDLNIDSKKAKASGDRLFLGDIVHEIKITFPQEYWEDSLKHNKAYKDSIYESKYLQCNVNIDDENYYACGIRYKGESSYQYYPSKKKSFRLKLNAFNKKQNHENIKGISLNNNFKDPSMMREKLILDYCNKNDILGQRSAFAKVYVNGEYYGVYTILENINKRFLKRKFGSKKGHFIQGKPRASFTYLENDTLAYKRSYTYKDMEKSVPEIMKITKVIHEGKGLENEMNLASLYKQFVVSNFFMNIDAYNMYFSHNFFLFKLEETDKFEWINYDYNYSFGAWSPDMDLKQMVGLSPYFVREKGRSPLLEYIFNSPEHKAEYTRIYKEMIKGFDLTDFSFQVKKYTQLLDKAVERDTLKMYSTQDFIENTMNHIGDIKDPGAFSPGLVSFMKARKAYLEEFFKEGN